MSPLEGRSNFKTATYLVWDEWRGAGEDLGTTGGYRSWWEAHLLVWLTIPRVLDDDDIQPAVDDIVRGEEDALGDRDLVGGGRGSVRQRRGVVIWRGMEVAILA